MAAQHARFQTPEAVEANGREAQEWAMRQIDDRPFAALCAVFAAGLVVGVGLTTAVPRRRPTPASRLEALSSRISEAVSQAIPQNLAEYFGR